MGYKIIPHSDDILYTDTDDNTKFTGENSNYLPVNLKDKYLVEYDIGLLIKAELTVDDGWILEVIENPFKESSISIERKDDNNDDILIIDTEEDLGSVSIEDYESKD